MKNSTHSTPIHNLSIQVREVAQLFHSMDPTPFLNKDINPEAEVFIESWASEFTAGSRFRISIHLERQPLDGDPSEMLSSAIHNHFAYKAERTRKNLKYFLQQGRISLIIGIVFVAICLIAADTIGKLGTNTGTIIARESLTIVGWVAMWRPLQIFLYDWWPFRRKIKLYHSLSHAHIQVMQGK